VAADTSAPTPWLVPSKPRSTREPLVLREAAATTGAVPARASSQGPSRLCGTQAAPVDGEPSRTWSWPVPCGPARYKVRNPSTSSPATS